MLQSNARIHRCLRLMNPLSVARRRRLRANLPGVNAQDVRDLRKELGCTARQLAAALGVEERTVFDWESGERFPTKKACTQMQALKKRGPEAFKTGGKPAPVNPAEIAGSPRVWTVARKLLRHPELLERVEVLAAEYEDVEPDR